MTLICERIDKLIKDNKPLQIHIGNHWVDFDGETNELLKFHRADIREKPEKEFILGDWWIPWNGAKPEKLTIHSIVNYNGTKPHAQNTNVKLWQPKPDEWCWFWCVSNFDAPILSRFCNMKDNLFTCTNSKQILFTNCEPFIGQLPTILKDK